MKRTLFSLVAVCMLTGMVFADLLAPPQWAGDPHFTHQTWSFNDPGNPAIPDDGGAGNPYTLPGGGGATLSYSPSITWDGVPRQTYSLTGVPGPALQGGLLISGPQEPGEWFTIDIPNSADPTLKKEVWFEFTFRVPSQQFAEDLLGLVDFSCYADGIIDDDHKFADELPLGYPIGIDFDLPSNPAPGQPSGVWVVQPGIFRFDSQPDWERLVFTGTAPLPDDVDIILDKVDIYTHCVPEPASICLLGLGAVGLLRRKR